MNETLEAIGNVSKSIGKGVGIGLGVVAGTYLATPTTIRKIFPDYDEHNDPPFPGFFVLMGASLNIAAPVILHKCLNLPVYLAISPLYANLASGIYEWIRYEKNKLKLPKTNARSGNLETKLEEPIQAPQITQPQKSKYTPIQNPWSIETPEIKSIIGER